MCVCVYIYKVKEGEMNLKIILNVTLMFFLKIISLSFKYLAETP